MATLLLKASCKKQHSVYFLWTKELSTNAFESEVHTVYGDEYVTRPATQSGVRSLLMVENVLLMRK